MWSHFQRVNSITWVLQHGIITVPITTDPESELMYSTLESMVDMIERACSRGWFCTQDYQSSFLTTQGIIPSVSQFLIKHSRSFIICYTILIIFEIHLDFYSRYPLVEIKKPLKIKFYCFFDLKMTSYMVPYVYSRNKEHVDML